MSSNLNNDMPAAKMLMKVPAAESLVEVSVSPPDSNFQVKVTPGDEVIELHIQAGCNSFVEVRIIPPSFQPIDKTKNKSQISIIGNTTVSKILPEAKLNSDESFKEKKLESEIDKSLLQESVSSLTEATLNKDSEYGFNEDYSNNLEVLENYSAPSIYENKVEKAVLETNKPDKKNIIDSIDIKPFSRPDHSGIPGPVPEMLEQCGPVEKSEDKYASTALISDDVDFEDDEVEFKQPLSLNRAAEQALARLSAAVEKEKAEMAANLGETHGRAKEKIFTGGDNKEKLSIMQISEESSDRGENKPNLARRSFRNTPMADSTVMVHMYKDQESHNLASESNLPLSEDEEMEIGFLGDSLSVGQLDVDDLDDLNIEPSSGKNSDQSDYEGQPRAKPLSTVIPGNTIIPK